MLSLDLLGGLSAQTFLRDYWQKKPLLIRQAIPGFTGLLTPEELLVLAGQDDCTARLVHQQGDGWQLRHGPFRRSAFPALKSRQPWTVLVQELNHHLRSAEDLLQRFSFIPHARRDDLMVSLASPSGGVGPHFDSYDVFLLQGMGERHWQISTQTDLTLIDDLPLKILRRFTPEQEWVLAPGDMLYLPPHCAHNGIAVGPCMTYSIGFRAPSAQEIATQFLIYLQDRLQLNGVYVDPDLSLQEHPAQIGEPMLEKIAAMVNQIRWDKHDIAEFTGCYLSEPKAHVFFSPPETMPSHAGFCRQVLKTGVRLTPQSLMLCYDKRFFLNGEPVDLAGEYESLIQLADTRQLAGAGLSPACLDWLYTCHEAGFILIEEAFRKSG